MRAARESNEAGQAAHRARPVLAGGAGSIALAARLNITWRCA